MGLFSENWNVKKKNSFEVNVDKLHENKFLFNKIFNISLSRFMNPLFGFDIINFDQWLKVPDGISCKNFIKKKWGYEAVELIENLIS